MRFLLIFVLLVTAKLSYAGSTPRIAPEPSWLYKVSPDFSKKPDLKKISDGYYLDLYDEQINCISQTTYRHVIRKILNESGIQDGSEISLQFSPEYQTVSFHYIRVIRNGIVINQLSLNEIKVVQEETDVVDYQYNGRKRAYLVLKDIRKGDQIEAAYSISGFNPVFENKTVSGISFTNGNPILNYYHTVIADKAKPLHFQYNNNCPKPEEYSSGNMQIYHWNNPPLTLWESLSGVPSWYDPYPSVVFSSFNEWQEVVNWGLRTYNDYRFEIPAGLKTKIAGWKNLAAGNNDEFTRLALRFVQDDIRYLGFEVGVNTHRPHSPAEVFKNGYGDCKDKALLLALILRSENIPAHAALVNTELKTELSKHDASPGAFDHVIVAIGEDKAYRFIDPTMSYQRGKLSDMSTPAYGYALLLKPGENKLQPIRPDLAGRTVIMEKLKSKFYDTSVFTVNTRYYGAKAESIREHLATTSESDLADNYLKYYAAVYEGIVADGEIIQEDDTTGNGYTVIENYKIPSLWSLDDSKRKTFLTYSNPFEGLLTDPAGKPDHYPLKLGYPANLKYTLELEMPEAWDMDREDLHIKNDSYEFSLKTSVHGAFIKLEYSLVSFRDHIPAAMIEQYKKDYKKIDEVMQFRFTYGGEADVSGDKSGGGLNGYAVIVTLLVVAGVGFAFYHLNRRSVEVPYDREGGYPLGGWVLVLGITLGLSLLRQLYAMSENSYFSEAPFSAWKTYGDGFVALAFIELAFVILQIAFAAVVFYWFLKKRDIFPSMFTAYITVALVTQAILYMLYKQYANTSEFEGTVKEAIINFFRVLVYGGIWCAYLAKSARAKATFLRSN